MDVVPYSCDQTWDYVLQIRYKDIVQHVCFTLYYCMQLLGLWVKTKAHEIRTMDDDEVTSTPVDV
jgi:hypothetical protein